MDTNTPNHLTVVLDHFDTPDGDDYALHPDFTNDSPDLNIIDYIFATITAVAEDVAAKQGVPEDAATTLLLAQLVARMEDRYPHLADTEGDHQ